MAATSRPSPSPADAPGPDGPAVVSVARRMCPYLAAEDGAWRSTTPRRDQRCGALDPPAPLAVEKQRRLCLTDEHRTCATFLAAAPASRQDRPDGRGATRWTLVRTVPVVLDGGRVSSAADFARRRSGPQLALGGLMALALAAIVLAKLPGAGASPAGALVSPSPAATARPTATVRPTPRATATPRPTAMPAPSPSPTIAPSPTPAVRTYRVVAGDTLYAIAIRYRTTIKAIVELNDLSSTNLRIGQVLKIP